MVLISLPFNRRVITGIHFPDNFSNLLRVSTQIIRHDLNIQEYGFGDTEFQLFLKHSNFLRSFFLYLHNFTYSQLEHQLTKHHNLIMILLFKQDLSKTANSCHRNKPLCPINLNIQVLLQLFLFFPTIVLFYTLSSQ